MTSGVASIYLLLLVVDGEQWALKGRLDKVFLSYGLPLKHVQHFSFPLLVFGLLSLGWKACPIGSMKQELFDTVSLFWAFLSLSRSLALSLSLLPIDFIGVEGLALEGRSGKGSLGYGLACGLTLHVFVCCCWGGRVVHLRA